MRTLRRHANYIYWFTHCNQMGYTIEHAFYLVDCAFTELTIILLARLSIDDVA